MTILILKSFCFFVCLFFTQGPPGVPGLKGESGDSGPQVKAVDIYCF